MARRRRPGQSPVPKKVHGSWKIWYRIDEVQPDGSVKQVQRTKVLGLVDEMTASEAKVAARAFIAPINALATGVEFRRHVFGALVAKWRATAARTLRPETLRGYEWALGRILPAFESVPVSQIEKPDIEGF